MAAVLASVLVGVTIHVGSACTGFAVYSGRALYGMNFDYGQNEIRFTIDDSGAGALFLGSFLADGYWAGTVGMNEHGLFSSEQMVFPPRATVDEPAEDELHLWDAFEYGLRECESVGGVLRWIGERHLVQDPSLQLHNLYADPTGDARVVEAGPAGNVITGIEGPFLVMTNFHNGDFRGLELRDIAGVGAERYRVAHRYLEEQIDAFDVDHALELLRRTATSTGDFTTRCSLVFDPGALEIYVALERDYDHIWKVSMVDRTIETYRGFAESQTLRFGASGVFAETLRAHAGVEPVPTAEEDPGLRWPLVMLIVGGVLGAALLLALMR